MSTAQKWIAVCGLAAITIAAMNAPYDYRAQWNSMAGLSLPRDGTTYAPIWNAPTAGYQPQWMLLPDQTTVTEIRLDAGKLGVWWAGIVLISVVGILLASPKKATQ